MKVNEVFIQLGVEDWMILYYKIVMMREILFTVMIK